MGPIIYRDDFTIKETNFGEPEKGIITYADSRKIFDVNTGITQPSWGEFGDLQDMGFEAKKGLEISLKVLFGPIAGTPDNWMDCMWGCVVDSEVMPDLYYTNALAFYLAPTSALVPIAGPGTGLTITGTAAPTSIALNTLYQTVMKVNNSGNLEFWFNGEKIGETAESVIGKMLMPYRNPYTLGAHFEIDSLVVRK